MIYYETLDAIIKGGIAIMVAIVVLGIGYAFGYSDGRER